MYSSLANVPTYEEIKSALFEMGPPKALGPDGFHPTFFQNSLDILGPRIVDFVQEAFRTATFLTELNKTTLCLIPKCSGPSMVDQFRPISLCNTVYKIITKTLFNRLKSLMPGFNHTASGRLR